MLVLKLHIGWLVYTSVVLILTISLHYQLLAEDKEENKLSEVNESEVGEAKAEEMGSGSDVSNGEDEGFDEASADFIPLGWGFNFKKRMKYSN